MLNVIYRIDKIINIELIYICIFLILNMLVGCSNEETFSNNTSNNYIYKEIKQINTKAVKLEQTRNIDGDTNEKTYFIIEVENTICPNLKNNTFEKDNSYTDISILGNGLVLNKKINDNSQNMKENVFIECFPYNNEYGSREGKSIIYMETDATINAGPITLIINKNEQITTFTNYEYESPTIITNNKFKEIKDTIYLPIGNNETGFANEMVLFIKPKDIKMYKRKIIATEPNKKYRGYEAVNISNTVNEKYTGFINVDNKENYYEVKKDNSNFKISGYEDYFNNVVNCFQNKDYVLDKTCGLKITGLSKNHEILNIAYNKSDKELTPDSTKIIVERNIHNKFKLAPRYKRLPEVKKNMYFLMDITSYNIHGELEKIGNNEYEILFNNEKLHLLKNEDYFKVDSLDSIDIDSNKNTLAINYNKFFSNLFSSVNENGIANLKINVMDDNNVNNSLSEVKLIQKDMFEILPIRYFEIDNSPIKNNQILELENNRSYNLVLRKISFGNGKIFEINENNRESKKHIISREIDYKIDYESINLTDGICLKQSSNVYKGITHCNINSEGDCFITINVNRDLSKNNSIGNIKIPFQDKEYFNDIELKILIK